MKNRKNHIRVFEHQSLIISGIYDDVEFTEEHLNALSVFFSKKGCPYYSLINKGIRLTEYVGVIKVGDLTIEVLPKADKYTQKDDWSKILISMLRTVNAFNVRAPSSSSLSIKSNFILDLYFELFVKEIEYLINKGLINKYRKTEGNRLALKGAIQFGKHIQQNLVHQERFYIKHSSYDKDHLLHQIINKTLNLLRQINTNEALNSRIGNLSLNFPETKDVKVNEGLFERVIYDRKTEEYKNAIEISKLLLLNYHPDLNRGRNHVLALMFDMNLLWERFIYISLRKRMPVGYTISTQTSKYFWKPANGSRSSMRPDIVINKDKDNAIVLDAKWKNLGNKNPSPDDLRQMFVYHKYYHAQKVALVYPGDKNINQGAYYDYKGDAISDDICSVISVPTYNDVKEWQEHIANQVFVEWPNLTEKSIQF